MPKPMPAPAEEQTQSTQEPTNKPCSQWQIISIVAIAALVGGLLVYFFSEYSKNEIEKQVTILQEKNYYLEQEIRKLQGDKSGGLSDWQTYTNDDFGYSINYPADWYIPDWVSDSEVIILPVGTDEESEGAMLKGLTISYFTDESKLALLTEMVPVVINGIPAEQGEDHGLIGYTATLFQTDDGYIKVYWSQNITDEIYNQILSTFQFLD